MTSETHGLLDEDIRAMIPIAFDPNDNPIIFIVLTGRAGYRLDINGFTQLPVNTIPQLQVLQ